MVCGRDLPMMTYDDEFPTAVEWLDLLDLIPQPRRSPEAGPQLP
ncbi:hypothetical protein [Alloactinosynnema sp. L-07]|nr:hypothetical protein [Alloactinosynnema sp. L-07]